MEEDLVLAADLADLLDGLDDTNLVVDHHHGDDGRIGADGSPQLIEVKHPVRIDREVGDLEALLLEVAARVEHALRK